MWQEMNGQCAEDGARAPLGRVDTYAGRRGAMQSCDLEVVAVICHSSVCSDR